MKQKQTQKQKDKWPNELLYLPEHDLLKANDWLCTKGLIISKGLLVFSNSPKKWTNEFVFTTTMNSFVRLLGEFEDTKKSFQNYLIFKKIKNQTFMDYSNTVWVGHQDQPQDTLGELVAQVHQKKKF